MRYTQDACIKAEEILSARKNNAELEQNSRYLEVAANAPEIVALDKKLKANRFKLLRCVGNKNRDENFKSKLEQIKKENLEIQHTMRELLKTCGYTEDYLDCHYQCQNCNDTGYRDSIRCKCLESLLLKLTTDEINNQCSINLHKFSEFSLDFYPCTGNGVNPREQMKNVYLGCKNYADNFGENSASLLLFGRTGLGKTFLSSCIAEQLINQGVNVVFGSILTLLRKIEDEHFGRAAGTTAEILKGCELLILDDLGSEFQTSFTDSVIYEILNDRINLEKPTIISTNLTMQALNSKYNERIVSRITGCFSPLMFLGADIRHEILKSN